MRLLLCIFLTADETTTTKELTWIFPQNQLKYLILLLKSCFLLTAITGKNGNTSRRRVAAQRCFRLDGKLRPPNVLSSSTTTAEAPFSSPLQPKMPLWKYLMAHSGKTLFITVPPSGMKVHNCITSAPSSTEKVYACPAVHLETEINVVMHLFILNAFSCCFWGQRPKAHDQTVSLESFFLSLV